MCKVAPTLEELLEISSQRASNTRRWAEFPHGRVSFQAIDQARYVQINVDFWYSRRLRADVLDWIMSRHREYLQHRSLVPMSIHCGYRDVLLKLPLLSVDADLWLRCLFVVASKTEFLYSDHGSVSVSAEHWTDIERLLDEEEVNSAEPEESKVETRESLTLAKGRVGQQNFATEVIGNFGGVCCFPGCDVDDPVLLVASHIVRWADDEASRGDVGNGLCLCANHDRAFEYGLFSLNEHAQVEVRRKGESLWAQTVLLPFDGHAIKHCRIRPSSESILKHRIRHGFLV